MGINLGDEGEMYKDLLAHMGHQLEVANYGDGDNIAIECLDCGCVLVSANRPPATTYTVEYDLCYSGGEPTLYDKDGETVNIETDLGESLEHAFERVTGHHRMHILEYHIKGGVDDLS